MIDSTNPRITADNIRYLSRESGSQASDISNLKTTVAAQGNAIEALGAYVIGEEVNTGKTLGDNDIFRKVFKIDSLPNATSASFSHEITNLGYVLLLCCMAQVNINAGREISTIYNNTTITISTGINFSDSEGIVIIEYTKSDAPAALTSPAPDDSRSIESEVIEDPEIRSEEIEPEVNEEAPEEEPVVETKSTTRKKTSTK